jgi:hypothetical protein
MEVRAMATANSIATDDVVLQRLCELVGEKSALAWKMYNVLAFVIEALPDDTAAGLPVQNTLIDIRCELEELATSLQDAVDNARSCGGRHD